MVLADCVTIPGAAGVAWKQFSSDAVSKSNSVSYWWVQGGGPKKVNETQVNAGVGWIPTLHCPVWKKCTKVQGQDKYTTVIYSSLLFA